MVLTISFFGAKISLVQPPADSVMLIEIGKDGLHELIVRSNILAGWTNVNVTIVNWSNQVIAELKKLFGKLVTCQIAQLMSMQVGTEC